MDTRRHSWVVRIAIAAAFCLGCGLGSGCGKVGPPQPPLTRGPVRPNQLAATQVGDRIRLAWGAPHLDLRAHEGSAVRRVDVYRLRQSRDVALLAFEDEFEDAADIVGFIDYDQLKKQLQGDERLVYEDRLDLSKPEALSNTRFQYAVRYVDARGRPQALSNLVAVEPVPGIALPPSGLAFKEQQDQVVVEWKPPAGNIDGSQPAQVVGYNIYRAKPAAERLGRPLNDRPVAQPIFADRSFLYLTPYVYVVRSVSQGPEQLVESVDSERLLVTPRDVFPPSTPTNVTVASAGGVVSLFWPTNPERDVIGYNIYRADGEAGPTANWSRLNDKPVTRTTFRDDRVRTGSRYAYRVSAVDRYGNESAQSEALAETASP